MWEFIIPAAANLLGSVLGDDAAGDAADTQAAATAAGIAEQRRQSDRTYDDLAPYRAAGGRALGALEQDINSGISHDQVTSEPGYQFGLQQGQLGLDRKAAASGGRVSGAALKAASQYATNYASAGYGAAYQRKQDRQNRLAALAGIGQTSTNASAAAGSNAANAISGLIGAQGDATGAAQLARGNIWGNAVNQIGALGSRYMNQPQQQTPYRNDDPYRMPGYFGGAEGE